MGRIKLGIRVKIIFFTVLILFITAGIITTVSTLIYAQEYAEVLKINVSVIGQNLKYQLDKVLDFGISIDNLLGFEEQCKDITDKYGEISYASVVDTQGKILFHSDSQRHGEFLTSNNKKDPIDFTKEQTKIIIINNISYFHINIPVLNQHSIPVAAIGIGFPENNIYEKIFHLISASLIHTLLMIAAGIVCLFFILSLQIIKPITGLLNFTNEIRKNKQLNRKVTIKSKDEIGQLSASFNEMIEELYETTVSKDYLDNIFKNMIDMLIILNNKNEIKMINRSALEMLGYEKGDLINKKITFVIDIEKSFRNPKKMMKLLSTGRLRNIEMNFKTRSGTRIPVLLSSSEIMNSSLKNIICVATDLREQKENQKKLALLNEQLIKASHKSGMAEVATGVLHNIGNIMNSVNISAERIKSLIEDTKINGISEANSMLYDHKDNIGEYLDNDPKGKFLLEYYLTLEKNLTECSSCVREESIFLRNKIRMIKDFIETQQSYARFDRFNETVNIIQLLEDVLTIQEGCFEKQNVKIVRKYDAFDEIKLTVQKSKLIHVILNILTNAVEAMADTKKKRIIIQITKPENNNIELSIIDNGCGIEKKNLLKIFNYGFSTKEQGHGFGLHTCANYIQEMGGKISARSQGKNKGAAFILIFEK